MNQKILEIRQPDDFHCHLRDNEFLARTVSDTAKQFARAVVMPNLKPPVTTIQMAKEYQARILKNIPDSSNFKALMTLYLTETMSPDLMAEAKKSDVIIAAKLYPAGITTNSDSGIVDLKNCYPLFEAMQTNNLPLCIHGESITKEIDIFDREKLFLIETLYALLKNFPKLRIVLEHISTKAAVDFVRAAPKNVAATITPHHLYYNRNDLFHHGIHPHYFCMPILKREQDQQALIEAAISGDSRFFLGTDSAPHEKNKKENECGCAGIYSAHNAIGLYAELFDQQQALDKLENFASVFGAEFYQLPLNQNRITLTNQMQTVPASLSFGNSVVVPMKAGETISWQIL